MQFPLPFKMTGLLLVLYFVNFAAISGPNYNSVRSMGMGNVSVTIATDRTAIFNNPAGLCYFKDLIDLSLSPVVLSVDGRFVTLVKALNNHKDKLADISEIDEDFIDMLNEMDGQWVGFQYLPEITIATKNLGFGIYSTLPVSVRVESGHFIPKLALSGERDVVFTWAVGIPLRHFANRCGISVEYIQRTPLKETITTYSETFIYFDKIANNKALRVLGDFTEIKHGVSFDLSFMHDFRKFQGFRLGYNVQDILGIVGGEVVFPPDLSIGCAYNFPQMNNYKLIDNLIIAFEISNIFGLELESKKYEHFAKKLHAGIELDLGYGMVRMGMNQGYFTTGLGIRYGLFFMDYAFFNQELGYYPGQFQNKKHIVKMGADIRFKKKTRKTKSGNQESNSSDSTELHFNNKQPTDPKRSGSEPADNQNGIQNITVETAPVQNETQEGEGVEDNQNSYENAIEIEDDEEIKSNIESSDVKESEIENKNVEGREVQASDVESKNVESSEVQENNVESKNVEGREVQASDVESKNVESSEVKDNQDSNEKTIESTTEEEKIGWE